MKRNKKRSKDAKDRGNGTHAMMNYWLQLHLSKCLSHSVFNKQRALAHVNHSFRLWKSYLLLSESRDASLLEIFLERILEIILCPIISILISLFATLFHGTLKSNVVHDFIVHEIIQHYATTYDNTLCHHIIVKPLILSMRTTHLLGGVTEIWVASSLL